MPFDPAVTVLILTKKRKAKIAMLHCSKANISYIFATRFRNPLQFCEGIDARSSCSVCTDAMIQASLVVSEILCNIAG